MPWNSAMSSCLADLGQPGPVPSSPAARLQYWRDTRTHGSGIFFVARSTGAWWPTPRSRCELQENLGSALLQRERAGTRSPAQGSAGPCWSTPRPLAAADGRTIAADASRAPGRLRRRRHRPASGPPRGPERCPPATPAHRGSPAGRLPPGAGRTVQLASRSRPPRAPRRPGTRTPWPAPADYELLHWTDSCPEEHAAQLRGADVPDEHRRPTGSD